MTALQNKELSLILNDRRSGSKKLLEKLVIFFLKYHKTINNYPQLLFTLRKSLHSFEIIEKFIDKLQAVYIDPTRTYRLLKKYETDLQSVSQLICKNALPYLIDIKSLVTISNSATLLELLSGLYKDVKIIVCESRPLNEGRLFAHNAAKKGFNTKLITESSIAAEVEKCDCVVIGADSILKCGDVINKVGSYTLAVAAKHFNKPFYVVASKAKKKRNNSFTVKEHLPQEIWKNSPKEVSISNFYFERIPKELITKIITE